MPAYSFLFPLIVALPRGYDCTLVMPFASIAQHLAAPDADLVAEFAVVSEGRVVSARTSALAFRGGAAASGAALFEYREAELPPPDGPRFLEFSLREAQDRPVLTTRIIHGWYSIYSAPGKKSFFSDHALKYGSPQIIDQIATFQRYCEGYPVVHLDRARDLAESIWLINPYNRPILASIRAHDGRELPRLRVPPRSARLAELVALLRAGENDWLGQIQLTANNRVVTFATKHSLADPALVSDHEHLDPYRSDPTHMPLTLKARVVAGKWLRGLPAWGEG